MIFYTFGNKNDKVVIVEIFVEIIKQKANISNVDFVVVNLGNDIKKSLINACNLFAKTDLKYFKENNIKVKVSSSENYSSPFLTSLFYLAFICDRFNISPPKVLVAGDLMQDGASSKFKFSLLDKINKDGLFKEYIQWQLKFV